MGSKETTTTVTRVRRANRFALGICLVACGSCISVQPIGRRFEPHVEWERDDSSMLASSQSGWTFESGMLVDQQVWDAGDGRLYLADPWTADVGGGGGIVLRGSGDGEAVLFSLGIDGDYLRHQPARPVDGCETVGWASFSGTAVAYCRRESRLERASLATADVEWSLLSLVPEDARFTAAFETDEGAFLLAGGGTDTIVVRDGPEEDVPATVAGTPSAWLLRIDPTDAHRYALERLTLGPHQVCRVADWLEPEAECQSLGTGMPLASLEFIALPEGESGVYLTNEAASDDDVLWVDGERRTVVLDGPENLVNFGTRTLIDVDEDGVDELLLHSGTGEPAVLHFDGDRTFSDGL